MLVFLVVCALMLLACALPFFRSRGDAPAQANDSPEWAVLRAKRDEIESDVALSPQARDTLRSEWAREAEVVLARAAQNTQATEQVSFDKRVPRTLALIALTLGVAIYALVGQWDAEALEWHGQSGPLAAAPQDPPPRDDAKHPGDNQSLDERIAALRTKLEQKPDDINGWVLLARTHGAKREFAAGTQALEKALALAPGHPDLLADLADMLAMTQNKTLEGRPLELIDQALKADPQHQKSLALAATAAMMRGDNAASAGFWKRLRATLPEDSPDRAQIDATLASLGGAAPAASAAASGETSGARITGQITLAPATLAKLKQAGLPSGAALFVVAKASGGPPMPLAAIKLSPAALLAGTPIDFTLDDSAAMNPQVKLSSASAVDVEARISMSGTPARGPQDVAARVTAVPPRAAGLRLALE